MCVFLGLYGLCHVCLWRKKNTFAQIISHLPHCDVVSFFNVTIFVMFLFEIIFFSCVIEISKENPHLYANTKIKNQITQMDLAKTINKNKSKAIQHRSYKYLAYIFAFDSIPY